MLATKFLLVVKFGAEKLTLPMGIFRIFSLTSRVSGVGSGQLPPTGTTEQTPIAPASAAGATGTNCVNIPRLVVESPGSARIAASPAAVGAVKPPGEAASPDWILSKDVKKKSLSLKIGP